MSDRITTTGTVEKIHFVEQHWSGGGEYYFSVGGVDHVTSSDRWLEIRRGDEVTFTHGGKSGRIVIKGHARAAR